MKYVPLFSLLVAVCAASVVYGENGKASGPANALANEVMSKVVYRSANVRARAEACRLRISFEPHGAVFDLPLHGTTVAQTATQDGVLVKNKNMTRTIRDRAPESFEQLTLRLHRDQVRSMLRTFDNAIASCGGSVVARAH